MPPKKRTEPPTTGASTPPPKKAAPSEDYRELIQEVRNLSVAVSLLHTIFVKRRVLYTILGIETAVVVIALIVMGVFIGLENAHQNSLVNKSTESCKVRNAQTDATKTYLARTVAIQQESQALNAKFLTGLNLHLSKADLAEAHKIQADYTKALNDYFHAQPQDIVCGKLKN